MQYGTCKITHGWSLLSGISKRKLLLFQIPKLRPFITEVNQTDQLHEALDIYRRQTRMKYEVETDKTECNRLGYDQHIGFPGLHTSRIKVYHLWFLFPNFVVNQVTVCFLCRCESPTCLNVVIFSGFTGKTAISTGICRRRSPKLWRITHVHQCLPLESCLVLFAWRPGSKTARKTK